MENKKTAIITGATKGIGEAISTRLAEENYNVIIFGRDLERLRKLKNKLKDLGSNTIFFSGDVADENFVLHSFRKILKLYPQIDVLVNNAGVAFFEKFVDSNLEQFKRTLDTNVIGVYNFCKAAIKPMLDQSSGTIVNIVSLAGKSGFKFGTMYAASKHAVLGFSKSLMQEVRNENIHVVSICPGSVETDMIIGSPIHSPNKQLLKPNDIADVLISILKLPDRALVSEIEIRPNNP